MSILSHFPKHNTILTLYVRVQLCEAILLTDNVEYCVWYAWLHYDVDVAAQGSIVFLNDNVGKAMCVERVRFFSQIRIFRIVKDSI